MWKLWTTTRRGYDYAKTFTADSSWRAFVRGLHATAGRNALARELRVPPQRISEIVKGRRGISADTALRLGRYFNTSPEFWINLQTKFDLRSAMEIVGPELRLVRARRVAA